VADELVAEFADPINSVLTPDKVFSPSILFAIQNFKYLLFKL